MLYRHLDSLYKINHKGHLWFGALGTDGGIIDRRDVPYDRLVAGTEIERRKQYRKHRL